MSPDSGGADSGRGRVLVLEDDRDIALGICTVLAKNGFDATCELDGREGLRVFHDVRPDLVVLDIGLPTLDGWQVLERIRDLSDVPVLILTAYGLEADKVRGLDGGADDYLTKPFGNRELVARVEALLRRPRADQPEPEVYDDGSLLVRLDDHEVRVNGAPVALTPIEYRLLAALVRHPGRIFAPDQLLELAWNDPLGIGPERVKFAIMRLRRKLGKHGEHGSAIEAVRGFGYRYAPRQTVPQAGQQAGQQGTSRPADSAPPRPRSPMRTPLTGQDQGGRTRR
jgi:DNA-binding response OmpR family regulator